MFSQSLRSLVRSSGPAFSRNASSLTTTGTHAILPAFMQVADISAAVPVPTYSPQQSMNVQSLNTIDLGVSNTLDSLDMPFEGIVDCPSTGIVDPVLAIKRTYQPSVLRRQRKHGFLKRTRTVVGRRTLKRRLEKGRSRLSA